MAFCLTCVMLNNGLHCYDIMEYVEWMWMKMMQIHDNSTGTYITGYDDTRHITSDTRQWD